MRGTIRRVKSSISKARSYMEIGKFWDEHDLTEFWRGTRKAKFTMTSPTTKHRVRKHVL